MKQSLDCGLKPPFGIHNFARPNLGASNSFSFTYNIIKNSLETYFFCLKLHSTEIFPEPVLLTLTKAGFDLKIHRMSENV